ncbi:MAG: hypothetical protein KDE14_13670 [Rhodobacteraceae bacterium]|nr:hypothetical protein [Paracoccaceae bacterium]
MRRIKRNSFDPLGSSMHLDEVLFEIVAIGNSVKVSAIDPLSNTEVSIIGAPSMTRYSLKMNALRKLEKVMRDRAAKQDAWDEATVSSRRRRGLYA